MRATQQLKNNNYRGANIDNEIEQVQYLITLISYSK